MITFRMYPSIPASTLRQTEKFIFAEDKFKNAMNIFISQPMQGRTDYDIIMERKYILHLMKSKYWPNIVTAPSYKRDFSCETTPLYLLGNAIKALSKADIAIFLSGWEHYRGCKIEYICCKEYGIPTVELVGDRLRRC